MTPWVWKENVISDELSGQLTGQKTLDIGNIWKVFHLYELTDDFWAAKTQKKSQNTDHIWKVSRLYELGDDF
jgi:hypothetical protein